MCCVTLFPDELLVNLLRQLAAEDVHEPADLQSLSFAEVIGSDAWTSDVIEFMKGLCMVREQRII